LRLFIRHFDILMLFLFAICVKKMNVLIVSTKIDERINLKSEIVIIPNSRDLSSLY
jgi:hypothetical protein